MTAASIPALDHAQEVEAVDIAEMEVEEDEVDAAAIRMVRAVGPVAGPGWNSRSGGRRKGCRAGAVRRPPVASSGKTRGTSPA